MCHLLIGNLLANTGLAVANYVKGTGTPYFIPIIAADDLTQRARIKNVIRVAGYTASALHPSARRLGAEAGLQEDRHHQPGLHLRPRAVRRPLPRSSPKAAARSCSSSGTRSTPPTSAPISASSPISRSMPSSRWRPAPMPPASSSNMPSFGLKAKIPLLGAMNGTDQSVIRTLGEECRGHHLAGAFRRGLGQSGHRRNSSKEYEAKYGKIPSLYGFSMYSGVMWIDAALKKMGGKVEDREAFIDSRAEDRARRARRSARSSSSMPTATRSTTSTSARCVKRADGKFWNVPVTSLSERLAVLEIRSGDLHEAAALFAHLPGHQEGLIHADERARPADRLRHRPRYRELPPTCPTPDSAADPT